MGYYEELTELDARSMRLRQRTPEMVQLHGQIMDLVFAEHSPEMSREKCELIWSQAWERGHSLGYHEVASEYQDLVDWLDKLEALDS